MYRIIHFRLQKEKTISLHLYYCMLGVSQVPAKLAFFSFCFFV